MDQGEAELTQILASASTLTFSMPKSTKARSETTIFDIPATFAIKTVTSELHSTMRKVYTDLT